MKSILALLASLLLVSITVHAAGPSSISDAISRVALVVGNSAYPSGALENPSNDAAAVAESFRRLGFDVDLKVNATKADMDAAMKRFGNKAEKAEVALLFYAGHGIQVNGYNYLVPIDAKPHSERDLKREMIKLDDIIDDMGNAKVKIIFFDACRDNPLARSFTRGGSRGLAPPVEASGTLISFATKHGNTASDGEGKHSPFTEALLVELANPLDEIERLLKRVNQNVKKNTSGQQEPWKYGSLDGDFHFVAVPATSSSQTGIQPVAADPATVELTFWNGAQQANSGEAFRAYLQQYPNGRFSALAQANIARLTQAPRLDPAALELTYWNRIADSRDADDYTAYLHEFPNGAHAAEARLMLNRLKRGRERSSGDVSQAQQTAAPVEAWSVGKQFRDCAECPEMLVVPAGSFTMGSPASEKERFDDEGPQHLVTIPKAFAVAKYEITRGQFAKFVSETVHKAAGCSGYDPGKKNWVFDDNRSWLVPGFDQNDTHPVVCVSWNDAKEYVKWLSAETGKEYRLLSESEWEYAARAGTSAARYWGADPANACGYANVGDRSLVARYPDWRWEVHDCQDGAAHTSPVGRYQPNRFGLRDMLGNVWEWVEDCYHDNYEDAPNDGKAWTNGGCGKRIVRGSSWDFKPRIVRSAYRGKNLADYRSHSIGFRVARMLNP